MYESQDRSLFSLLLALFSMALAVFYATGQLAQNRLVPDYSQFPLDFFLLGIICSVCILAGGAVLLRYARRRPGLYRRLLILGAGVLILYNLIWAGCFLWDNCRLTVLYHLRGQGLDLQFSHREASSALLASTVSFGPSPALSQDGLWWKSALHTWDHALSLPLLTLHYGRWILAVYIFLAVNWLAHGIFGANTLSGFPKAVYLSCLLPLALPVLCPALDTLGLIRCSITFPDSFGPILLRLFPQLLQLTVMVQLLRLSPVLIPDKEPKLRQKLYLCTKIAEGEITMRLPLNRFYNPQKDIYDTALAEIRSGKKTSHWIWYIFPQLQGLGRSTESWYYGIQDLQEARDFMADPMLSAHLLEITGELLKLDTPIEQVMLYPDDLKLRSSMTLFSQVSQEPVFQQVLDRFFGCSPDALTLRLLEEKHP